MDVPQASASCQEDMDMLVSCDDDVLEEIEDVEECQLLCKSFENPATPEKQLYSPSRSEEGAASAVESPSKVRRMWNISPISELLDDGDGDYLNEECEEEEEEPCQKTNPESDDDNDDDVGKITPEPKPQQRASFPRISDGRSSPILAYSPSFLKSPSSNGAKSKISKNSPSLGGAGAVVGKRPRNISRMLDNISDHSSGEDDVSTVNSMMAKISV